MIQLTAEGKRKRGRDARLVHGRQLAEAVDLRTQRCHAERVARSQRRLCIAALRQRDHLQVTSHIDLLAQLVPVRELSNTLRLPLRRRDPLLRRTDPLGHIAHGRLLNLRTRVLVHGLGTQRKARRERLEIVGDIDTGQIRGRRVQRLEVHAVVRALEVMLQLHKALAACRSKLCLDLGDVTGE